MVLSMWNVGGFEYHLAPPVGHQPVKAILTSRDLSPTRLRIHTEFIVRVPFGLRRALRRCSKRLLADNGTRE
jgi:hypothetical protein